MLNLILSLVAGLALTIGVRLTGLPWYAGIIPGTIAFIGVYIYLVRRIQVRLQTLTTEAQKELQGATSIKDQKQRSEKAVKILESALPLGRWQFLVESQLHGAIGQIHYMMRDLDKAELHFRKSTSRDYMSAALMAALLFQKKDFAQMEAKFEEAVKSGKKEGIVWAAYAWCLLQQKEKDKALRVLARAVEANPSDEKLKGSLTALQNDKKLKMKAYEPLWWSFGLEQPPMQLQGGGRQVRFQRR